MLRARMLLNRVRKAVLAELAGTALLVAAVVGSGIAATRLSDDVGVQLLLNALATVAALGVLIHVLAPTSGAHLNPVVSVVAWARGSLAGRAVLPYVVAQCLGACAGTLLAHAMFEVPLTGGFAGDRSGTGQLLGEVVATLGLVVVAFRTDRAAVTVPAWIGAAYLFTSSTSFANPAVTLGRALTDTFSGIGWADVPGFVLAQCVGAALALLVLHLTLQESS